MYNIKEALITDKKQQRNYPKIVKVFAKKLPGKCQDSATKVQEKCQKGARNLPGICQEFVKNLLRNGYKYRHEIAKNRTNYLGLVLYYF